jgi:formylglycine-generating enzyme required for sulfatase activity
LGVGRVERNNPVYRVSVDDAHRFAHLLGGELPTPRQWDKAAGCFAKRQQGPFEGPMPAIIPNAWNGEFALSDKGPMAVGTATRDRSCFGCQDMASNGLEWSCYSLTLAPPNPPEERPIDFARKERVAVVVRGASYLANEPFQFDTMAELPQDRLDKDGKPATPHEVSFRVVLPVPFERAPADDEVAQ